MSQIGYSQSASLLAHNLIAAIAAFPWESALPRKQGSPPLLTHRFRLGGLEAGDFLDEFKNYFLSKILIDLSQVSFAYIME